MLKGANLKGAAPQRSLLTSRHCCWRTYITKPNKLVVGVNAKSLKKKKWSVTVTHMIHGGLQFSVINMFWNDNGWEINDRIVILG